MFPSCSHFTAASLKRYGYLQGTLMGADRIMRCGLDLRYYPRIYVNQRNLYRDLPEESRAMGDQ